MFNTLSCVVLYLTIVRYTKFQSKLISFPKKRMQISLKQRNFSTYKNIILPTN
ncbi:hypothetical protein A1OE_1489 [Candidatus Endolissoclinum faulkneri L2]|uniref:Uncharacterized protein n=1 Tax=Candidatus Endolissoclinum faulkneri L2 TaxID=1193729 RepID=K7Z656_9PROT|nr:hypothetical protein A1OE_1489 [Candidatus Endolissoclinum faulkneri L2]